MNCGFGEPGKFGMDLDIVSVRSIGFTPIEFISDLSIFELSKVKYGLMRIFVCLLRMFY